MYEDFTETNRIWFFTEDEVPKFVEMDLPHMVAGDTDSCYMSVPEIVTSGRSVEEVVATCDEIGGLIGDTFPEFSRRIFNCPADRLGSIKTDREAVSDKSLFLTKKRYIMHVVDMEGTPCDKLKVMGVESKKSDTSPAVKVLLDELVDAILDGKSMDDVLKLTNKMKREFATRFTPREIAKSVGCNTLKKAQNTFAATGDMKGIPYQARAAMFYNKMRTTADKEIYAGDKIKLIYIIHPESKYIGLPVDTEEPPEWFNEIIIDYKTEWNNANTKIVNYLKALGWDLESRKKQQSKDLFGF